jgi:hypothetical protein
MIWPEPRVTQVANGSLAFKTSTRAVAAVSHFLKWQCLDCPAIAYEVNPAHPVAPFAIHVGRACRCPASISRANRHISSSQSPGHRLRRTLGLGVNETL